MKIKDYKAIANSVYTDYCKLLDYKAKNPSKWAPKLEEEVQGARLIMRAIDTTSINARIRWATIGVMLTVFVGELAMAIASEAEE